MNHETSNFNILKGAHKPVNIYCQFIWHDNEIKHYLRMIRRYRWAVSRFCWFTCTKSTNTSDVFNRNLGTFKRNPPVMYSICTHHTLHTHEEHSIPVCTINGNIRSNNYNKNLHLWKDHREIWQLPYLKFFTWPYDFNPSIDL